MKFAKKFMANNKPIQKSKLSELNDDILLLVENGFHVKQIHECIVKDAKISVELKYLHRYIKKLKQNKENKKVEDKKEIEPTEKKNTLASYLKKTEGGEIQEWKPRKGLEL